MAKSRRSGKLLYNKHDVNLTETAGQGLVTFRLILPRKYNSKFNFGTHQTADWQQFKQEAVAEATRMIV